MNYAVIKKKTLFQINVTRVCLARKSSECFQFISIETSHTTFKWNLDFLSLIIIGCDLVKQKQDVEFLSFVCTMYKKILKLSTLYMNIYNIYK